ncbi:MAG TPA: molybdenum metabolism regulator [Enhygromyxa sp.]|nr:molybdenum metabolism regulator [Enhygromyxa sp.]
MRPAGSRNPELEAAIADNPSEDAWQVYFDWLQSQGDPWGERGNLALARDKAKGAAKAKLTKQIAEFDAAHGDALFGASLLELMKNDYFTEVAEVSEQYGLFWTVRVRSPEYDWSGTAPSTALAELMKSPAARLIQQINIGLMDHDPPDLQKGVDVLWEAESLPNLRSLFIGDFEYPDDTEISWIEDGIDATAMLKVAPRLRSLHIRGSGIQVGTLEHDTLERLILETGGLPEDAVESVGSCRLPALTHMEVWFGREGYGAGGNVEQLAGLLAGEGVPKLRHLGLKNGDWQDDIASALVHSNVLAQLETVDLSMGTMHGNGVEAIIANPAKLSHLKRLDLSDNYLSNNQVERVKAALGTIVEIGRQKKPYDRGGGDLRYYASVGE